jgi:ZIP family zinc transporter
MASNPFEQVFVAIAGPNPIWQGLWGGIVITALNTLGAIVVLIWRKPSEKFLDGALGFSAGVMLTASFTSLILPGIEHGGIWPVLVGMALGVLLLDLSDHIVPHLHAISGQEGVMTKRVRAVWLFILAITLHNMPEGLAVGVGFGSGDLGNALKLMLAIGIQNIPEGLAVSVSALSAGWARTFTRASSGCAPVSSRFPWRSLAPGRCTSLRPSCPMRWASPLVLCSM